MEKQKLEANADKVEQLTYSKPLSPEELEQITQQFIQKTIEIKTQEDELKAVKDEFKAILKPMKQGSLKMLQTIRTKQKTVTETVYLIANHENGTMETFSEDGEIITSRRLLPEEKQLSIHALRKAQ